MSFIIDWIECCLIFYWPSLIGCAGVTLLHKVWWTSTIRVPPPVISGWHDLALMVFVACCLWVVLCAARQGYGLG